MRFLRLQCGAMYLCFIINTIIVTIATATRVLIVVTLVWTLQLSSLKPQLSQQHQFKCEDPQHHSINYKETTTLEL